MSFRSGLSRPPFFESRLPPEGMSSAGLADLLAALSICPTVSASLFAGCFLAAICACRQGAACLPLLSAFVAPPAELVPWPIGQQLRSTYQHLAGYALNHPLIFSDSEINALPLNGQQAVTAITALWLWRSTAFRWLQQPIGRHLMSDGFEQVIQRHPGVKNEGIPEPHPSRHGCDSAWSDSIG